MAKDHIQDYWNWVGNIIGLPVFTAIAIWACLSLEKKHSFSISFGSGDLISVSAMMFIVLYQEISITPVKNRTPFTKFLHGFSLPLIALLWVIYGFAKYYAQINSDISKEDVASNLLIISIASSILLFAMGLMCMIQKYKLK